MSAIQLTLQTDNKALLDRIDALATRDLSEVRRNLVESAIRTALTRTIALNPVDTGRARSAWGAALEQLGGTPPAGWTGGNAETGALSKGAASGAGTLVESNDQTEARATNSVDYITLLEHGTSRTAAHHMARDGLLEARPHIRAEATRLLRDWVSGVG